MIRSRTHTAAFILLLSWTALGAACSGVRDPSMIVNNASIIERTDEALSVQFTMNLNNPNDQPLELLTFDYDLEIDGEHVYSGLRAAQATLAARGSREIHIPAVISYEAAEWRSDQLPQQTRYEISGTLRYMTPGEIARILYETGVRKPCAGFESEGEILLNAAPQPSRAP